MRNPTLGIDIDGTIDEAPIFFRLLTACWPGKIIIITFREDEDKARADLAKADIRFDEIVLVNSLEDKARVISEKGVLVFFDDQPETMINIPCSVNVMYVRNGGNFDFDSKKWLFSEKTGRLV